MWLQFSIMLQRVTMCVLINFFRQMIFDGQSIGFNES